MFVEKRDHYGSYNFYFHLYNRFCKLKIKNFFFRGNARSFYRFHIEYLIRNTLFVSRGNNVIQSVSALLVAKHAHSSNGDTRRFSIYQNKRIREKKYSWNKVKI